MKHQPRPTWSAPMLRRWPGLVFASALLCILTAAGCSGPSTKSAAQNSPATSLPTATSTTASTTAPAATTTNPSPSSTTTPAATTPSTSPTTSRTSASRTTPSPTTPPPPGHRTLTMVNKLPQTIWPALAADPKHPVAATGWVLPPGASVTIAIPDHWDVRVWARAGCAFSAAGTGHCLSGDCQGKFQCGSTWGEFPSTLAEFNLNAWQNMDFYDVSLVEGNNLPMYVNQTGGRAPTR